MRKLALLITFVIYFASYGVVAAASLSLNMIGSLDVSNTRYSQYWYTGSNPTLVGTASDSSVTVTVNGTALVTTADASGNWSQVVTLNDGDNSIVIADSLESYSFTLTKGDLPADLSQTNTTTTTTETTTTPDTSKGGETTLPDAGFGTYTILFMGLGLIAILGSVFALSKVEV